MAHFYGGVEGNRGPATRLGTKSSGMDVFAQGWNVVVKAYLFHDDEKGVDIITVYRTSGSNGGKPDKLIGEYRG